MRTCTIEELSHLIDHTNLHADATTADLTKLCEEARTYGFAMVAINQVQVPLCARLLAGSGVHVGAAISFPLGQTTVRSKVAETLVAIEDGANEIDYVVNVGAVRDGNWDLVHDEMAQIVDACHAHDVLCKVIFENCYLTDEQKLGLCQVASDVRPDFVKTSTGFGTGGATLDDVRLMRANVPAEVKVKAAGGIRTADDFLAYVRLGAERIGCSAGIPIIEELRRRLAETGTQELTLE